MDNRLMAPSRGYQRDGRTKQPEWQSWLCMVRRCYETAWNDYKNYGARGITVCDQWRYDYQTFLRDMGKKPSADHSLDRIDNNGNYEPRNCRWATRQQQMANRRICHKVTYKGRTLCGSEWARELGITPSAMRNRLKRWPLERALAGIGEAGQGHST